MLKRFMVPKSALSLLVLLVLSLAATTSFAELIGEPSKADRDVKPAPVEAADDKNSEADQKEKAVVTKKSVEVLLAGVDKASADAFNVLWNATVFEDEKIGYSGELSKNVEAFRVLWASPKAGELFEALGQAATPVGRLYGAAGLYHFDPKGFEVAIKRLRGQSQDRVERMSGCMAFSESVGDILESNEPKVVRLNPGQTLMDWFKLHKEGHLDLIGGGYTGEFAGMDVVVRPTK